MHTATRQPKVKALVLSLLMQTPHWNLTSLRAGAMLSMSITRGQEEGEKVLEPHT